MKYLKILILLLLPTFCLGQTIQPKQIDTAKLLQGETLDKILSRDSNTTHQIIITPPEVIGIGLTVNNGSGGRFTQIGNGWNLIPGSGGVAGGFSIFDQDQTTRVGQIGFWVPSSGGLNYGYLSSFGVNPYLDCDIKFIGGRVGIHLPGTGTPSAYLDVNGDARIRVLNNAAGDFVTTNANGNLSKRTPSEALADMGGITIETDPVLAASIKWGTETLTGDNSQTSFTIAHGLSTTPTSWSISANDSAAATALQQGYYVTADATNLTITFLTAPPTGNFKIAWVAYK